MTGISLRSWSPTCSSASNHKKSQLFSCLVVSCCDTGREVIL